MFAARMDESAPTGPRETGRRFASQHVQRQQSDEYEERGQPFRPGSADTAVINFQHDAVKDFSAGLAKINRPVLFAYQPESQSTADFLKSKLGDRLRLERFEGDGHALFVDEPEKFNHVLDEFIKGLPK
jgi:pimeloyl-ACP methyl ester carboxylesterase